MSPKHSTQRFLLFSAGIFFILAAGGIEPSHASTPAPEKEVVAKVNGESIYADELTQATLLYKEQSKKNSISNEETQALLKNLIRRRLILGQEVIKGYRKDEKVVKTVKDYEDNLVVTLFLKEKIGSHLKVSDQEIGEYYQNNLHQFSVPKSVDASHILVRTRAEADSILKELKNGGNFKELAKKYSIDLPMALDGGSMGTIEQGKGLPELETVLFTLAKGEVSGIVETKFGFHIMTVDEIILPKRKSLEDATNEIKAILLRQKEVKAYEGMAEQLEKGADIQNLLKNTDAITNNK